MRCHEMRGKRLGGRPRNAWTSSRRRKLARLYTMSTLLKREIQSVLREQDFHPSVRDIEEKLHSLFPPDYRKDYRSFRPSDERNMRLRLSRIGLREPGETMKQEDCEKAHNVLGAQSTKTHPENRADITFEDVAYIDPSLLLLNGPVAQSPGHPASPSAPSQLSDIVLLVPEPPGSMSTSHETAGHPSAYQEDNSTPHVEEIADPPRSPSYHDLEARLDDKYPKSYIKCINSMLRCSFSDSWRSSLSSFISLGSSKASRQSAEIVHPKAPAGSGMGLNKDDGFEFNTKKFSREQKALWKELINDSVFASASSGLSDEGYTSLTERPCCQLKIKPLPAEASTRPESPPQCNICRFTVSHFPLRSFENILPEDRAVLLTYSGYHMDLNAPDNFGNTPFHFLAASRHVTISGLLGLDKANVNLLTRNYRGQNFMHVLNHGALLASSGEEGYLELYKWLSHKKFDLHQRAYDGKTAFELSLASVSSQCSDQTAVAIKAILRSGKQIMTISPKILRELDGIFTRNFNIMLIQPIIEEVLENSGLALKHSFAVLGGGENAFGYPKSEIAELVEKLPSLGTVVDRDGDTLLISVLKRWGDEADVLNLMDLVEVMLQHGSEIHARDAVGDTVLAIACRRGLRPVVKFLIHQGANVHVRNARRQGVLVQCRRHLRKARSEENDGHYAKVLSCMNLVIDAGGKVKPTEIDEWSGPKPIHG